MTRDVGAARRAFATRLNDRLIGLFNGRHRFEQRVGGRIEARSNRHASPNDNDDDDEHERCGDDATSAPLMIVNWRGRR